LSCATYFPHTPARIEIFFGCARWPLVDPPCGRARPPPPPPGVMSVIIPFANFFDDVRAFVHRQPYGPTPPTRWERTVSCFFLWANNCFIDVVKRNPPEHTLVRFGVVSTACRVISSLASLAHCPPSFLQFSSEETATAIISSSRGPLRWFLSRIPSRAGCFSPPAHFFVHLWHTAAFRAHRPHRPAPFRVGNGLRSPQIVSPAAR